MVRVGQGYDIHRLETGRKLILGGIIIPWDKGLVGHSDADAVVHAVIDALLGAAGLGDIGGHFPDTDPAYKDIPGKELMETTLEKVRGAGFTPVNADLTIIAEQPKLQPYKEAMQENLARMMNLETKAVNIKAKTNEGLGEIGSGNAIACQAIVSLGMCRR
ncbi:MAG: 2-C-methyl-D-erythritol 2,4-cyclodiphosphate synthase [Sedimentisphaerales bacterium]|nr:2-C-methyl-D-erythritol 2,4-cyclodiphosphate synthase [Sedimentisphaerales bacterium]